MRPGDCFLIDQPCKQYISLLPTLAMAHTLQVEFGNTVYVCDQEKEEIDLVNS